MPDNPYAAPTALQVKEDHGPSEWILASRFSRFCARVIDEIILGLALILLPSIGHGVQIFSTETMGNSEPTTSVTAYTGLLDYMLGAHNLTLGFWVDSLMVLGLTTVFQGYLLARYGQSIGKWFLDIKIVDSRSKMKPKLATTLFVREGGMLLISLIPILAMVEILWIFGKPRRCIHDYWSKTLVVDALEGPARGTPATWEQSD